MDYKNTIITPKTDFPMKAGLPAREPGMLESWEKMDLYQAMLGEEQGSAPVCAPRRPSLLQRLYPHGSRPE